MEVIFYEKENGEKPIEEFIISLDEKMKSKALGQIAILKEKGRTLREPYSKYVNYSPPIEVGAS